MHYITRYFTGVVAAISAAVSLVSCVGDSNKLCPDEPDPDVRPVGVSIRFDISSGQSSLSRAADIEAEKPGTSAEDYIDTGKMQFLLFDDEQRFLQNLTPEVAAEKESGQYSALVTFKEPYIEQATSGNVTFYIMALANGSYMGGSWAGAIREKTTIADLCAARQNTVLTVKPNFFYLTNSGLRDSQRFPMAGLQHFTVSVEALKASTYEKPVDLSAGTGGRTLNMLRALAKIEVIDKVNYEGDYIEEQYENDPRRIDKAELVGYTASGNQLPLYSQWARNVERPETQQVVAPSIPSGAGYIEPPVFSADNDDLVNFVNRSMLTDMYYDYDATMARADKAPVNSVYIYEFSNSSTESVTVQSPFVRITTLGDPNSPGSSVVLPFRLGEYEDGKCVRELNEILRNHIYRYEVTQINIDGTYSLNWEVVPMSTVDITIPPFN